MLMRLQSLIWAAVYLVIAGECNDWGTFTFPPEEANSTQYATTGAPIAASIGTFYFGDDMVVKYEIPDPGVQNVQLMQSCVTYINETNSTDLTLYNYTNTVGATCEAPQLRFWKSPAHKLDENTGTLLWNIGNGTNDTYPYLFTNSSCFLSIHKYNLSLK
jgi:hypothetical protein